MSDQLPLPSSLPLRPRPGRPAGARRGRGALAGLAVGAGLLLAGCSGTRFIPEGAKLYVGSTVQLKSAEPIKNEAALTTELEGVLTPKPNASILGMRPKLYFWHLGEGKTRGLGHWLADKYGEKPVLLSQVDTQRVKKLMVNRLHNNGYFHPSVGSKVQVKGATATVDYTALVGKPYLLKEIHFPAGDSLGLLSQALRQAQAGTLLKAGEPYNLQTFVNERLRLDGVLKNQGFYYFAPEYLLFEVDSTLDNEANVYLKVKPSILPRAAKPYVLSRITLNTNYSLSDTTTNQQPVVYRKYRYYPDEKVFKARAITNATFLYPDSVYRRRRSDQTLSRLMSLGTFKFVDIRFRPDRAAPDSAGYGHLISYVRMTQVPKKSLRAEVLLVSKTNGFVGPGFRIQFRNRSALRGAEQLLVNVTGAFENQTKANSATIGVTSYELGADAQLLVPRLITPPFDLRLPNSDFQPRTTFGAGYKYVERRQAFQEDVFSLNYGYTWKTKITNEQELRPVDLQYIRLSSVSDRFRALLDSNAFLANSFRQQFILGSSYRYTYNQQVLEKRRNQLYFSGGLEVSGNAAYLLSSLTGQPKVTNPADNTQAYAVLNQEFSQYTKVDLELRNYFRTSTNPASGNKIATRLLIGAGLPYLNSTVLPYLKQYGIGGPNSVRAFRARGIGPGTYTPATTSQETTNFYDQVGDLRLEANAEYRQDLFPYVKGAVFVDAGNIWLVNPDPKRPGGQFQASSFLRQLAVGAGAGLRIDVEFFVIRFDVAVPLRQPNGAKPGTAPVFNIAIGYPF